MRSDSVEMKATVIMFLLAVVLVGWCSIALWSDCSSKHGDQAKVNKHAALTSNPANHLINAMEAGIYALTSCLRHSFLLLTY